MFSALKSFLLEANTRGVKIPLLANPNTNEPSITYTMMFISFNTALAGILGLKQVDMTNALTFFGITTGLYFGRTFTGVKKEVEVPHEQK